MADIAGPYRPGARSRSAWWVLGLLAMFAATGAAAAGHSPDSPGLIRALVVIAGFLVFSVAVKDLADEAIDRVNLPGCRLTVPATWTQLPARRSQPGAARKSASVGSPS